MGNSGSNPRLLMVDYDHSARCVKFRSIMAGQNYHVEPCPGEMELSGILRKLEGLPKSIDYYDVVTYSEQSKGRCIRGTPNRPTYVGSAGKSDIGQCQVIIFNNACKSEGTELDNIRTALDNWFDRKFILLCYKRTNMDAYEYKLSGDIIRSEINVPSDYTIEGPKFLDIHAGDGSWVCLQIMKKEASGGGVKKRSKSRGKPRSKSRSKSRGKPRSKSRSKSRGKPRSKSRARG